MKKKKKKITSRVETHHENPHLLLAEKALEKARESQAHFILFCSKGCYCFGVGKLVFIIFVDARRGKINKI
jgi:hypothetical protein